MQRHHISVITSASGRQYRVTTVVNRPHRLQTHSLLITVERSRNVKLMKSSPVYDINDTTTANDGITAKLSVSYHRAGPTNQSDIRSNKPLHHWIEPDFSGCLPDVQWVFRRSSRSSSWWCLCLGDQAVPLHGGVRSLLVRHGLPDHVVPRRAVRHALQRLHQQRFHSLPARQVPGQ